jgi:hypothetical protein
MIVNHTHRFMFFAEPHTASRACSRMLEEVEGSVSVGEHHMTHEAGRDRGLLPEGGYLRFSVIRDPRDLVASRIAHMVYMAKEGALESSPSKEELIERYVKAACVRRVYFEHDYVDIKIRYDQLEPQLYAILEKVGVNPIPKLGRSPYETTKEKNPWWQYFDAEQMARMRKDIPEIEQFTCTP